MPVDCKVADILMTYEAKALSAIYESYGSPMWQTSSSETDTLDDLINLNERCIFMQQLATLKGLGHAILGNFNFVIYDLLTSNWQSKSLSFAK